MALHWRKSRFSLAILSVAGFAAPVMAEMPAADQKKYLSQFSNPSSCRLPLGTTPPDYSVEIVGTARGAVQGSELLFVSKRCGNATSIYQVDCQKLDQGGWLCRHHLMENSSLNFVRP
jgi:hypothetical protein